MCRSTWEGRTCDDEADGDQIGSELPIIMPVTTMWDVLPAIFSTVPDVSYRGDEDIV